MNAITTIAAIAVRTDRMDDRARVERDERAERDERS